MVIEVKPYEQVHWGVYIDGVVFGVSKNSFDCDFAAWQLQRMFGEKPKVLNYPEDRFRLIAEMEERRTTARGQEKKSGQS